jgi:nicotinate-nucleotide adenylyltransferase
MNSMSEGLAEPALTSAEGRRVAFFGGSFDPPHKGHLAVARAARTALELDCVLFAPVGAQPLKPHGSTASFEDRLAMTNLAIVGEPDFAVSLADAPKPSGAPNYTLETLEVLRAQLPQDCALFCLMGADALFGLRRWHRAAEIPFIANLIVASRPAQRPGRRIAALRGALPEGLSMKAQPILDRPGAGVEVREYMLQNLAGDRAPFYLLPGLHVEISASQVREQIRRLDRAALIGKSAEDDLLPEPVFHYIRAHGLYR